MCEITMWNLRRNWLKNCIFWQSWNLSGCCQAFQMKKLSQSLMLPGSQCSNTCLFELKLYIQVFLPFHTVAKYGKMKVIDDDHSGAVLLPFLNTRITLHRSASWWCNGCSHELSVSLQMAFGIRRDHWPDFLGQVSVQEFLQALESGRLTEPLKIDFKSVMQVFLHWQCLLLADGRRTHPSHRSKASQRIYWSLQSMICSWCVQVRRSAKFTKEAIERHRNPSQSKLIWIQSFL